jgi:ABC-type nitrate/sulfonate/bicarbonate transport system ATPase subunit
VLLVTHDTREAVLLADRVVVLPAEATRPRVEIPVPLPRPRERLGAEPNTLETRLLDALGIASVD